MAYSKLRRSCSLQLLHGHLSPAFPLPMELRSAEQVLDRSVDFRGYSDYFEHRQVAEAEEEEVVTSSGPPKVDNGIGSPLAA